MILRTLPAGDKVVELVQQCVEADQALLLIGPHGVGKTDLFKCAAQALDIEYISRDLSLMEPPDLVGMPFIGENGRTHFAPPAFLPSDGRGLLVIEELNRAPRYMIAPCLQLLTERVLNDYVLPPGWIPMAAVNPQGEDYHVEELDPALLARFVQVQIQADATQWEYWASGPGNVHPKIIEFVLQSPGVFEAGETNPRAWTYLSKQLRAWEAAGRDREMLTAPAAGLVGESWAVAFNAFLTSGHAPLTVQRILSGYQDVRTEFKRWMKNGQLDLASASMQPLKRHLDAMLNYQTVVADKNRLKNVRWFVDDLPADMRKEIKDWFKTKSYDQLA